MLTSVCYETNHMEGGKDNVQVPILRTVTATFYHGRIFLYSDLEPWLLVTVTKE